MRKVFCIVLCISLMLLASCSAIVRTTEKAVTVTEPSASAVQTSPKATNTASPTATTTAEASSSNELKADVSAALDTLGKDSVKEYGDPQSEVLYEDYFQGTVFYPVADISEADSAVSAWAEKMMQESFASAKEEHSTDSTAQTDIAIDYNSYNLNGRYAGVVEQGFLSASYMAHPQDMTYVMNVDLEKGTLLKRADIWKSGAAASLKSAFLGKLKEAMGSENAGLLTDDLVADMDDSWFDYSVITDKGIDVVLPRSLYLPSAFGVQKISFTFAEAGSQLLIDFNNAVNIDTGNTAELSSASAAGKSIKAYKGWCLAHSLNVRGDVSTSSKELGTLGFGEKVAVTDKNAAMGWYEIKYKGGKGYVSSEFITFDGKPVDKQSVENGGSAPAAATTTAKSAKKSGKPMIALTFDDGPSNTTSRILNVLEKYGAKATFCVVGNRVAGYRSTVKRAVGLGCEIATHTWDHKKLPGMSKAAIEKELSKSREAVKKAAGVDIRFLRPPYGSVDSVTKAACKAQRLAIVNWSIDTEDWRTKNAAKTYGAIMKNVRAGSIILCHDLYPTTGDTMERVIPKLAQKYQLVTVSELLGSKGKIVDGTVYRYAK